MNKNLICYEEKGIDKPFSLHVDKDNEAAMKLYEKIGYKIHSEEESQYLMIANFKRREYKSK